MRIGFPAIGRRAEHNADADQIPIDSQRYHDNEDTEAQIYYTDNPLESQHKDEVDCECQHNEASIRRPAFLNYIARSKAQKGYDLFRHLLSTFIFAAILMFVIFRITRVEARGCIPGREQIIVQEGDTCWSIAERRGMTMDQMVWFNYGLICENDLKPGVKLCVWEMPD